ncbi:MAG: hypothetical protein CMP20_04450 [Rickettsiales bacterium]|nr:hypothetical protein [Rickettsiales bacterium]
MESLSASYGFATYNELRDAVVRGNIDVEVITYDRFGKATLRRSSDMTDAERRRIPRMQDKAPDPFE